MSAMITKQLFIGLGAIAILGLNIYQGYSHGASSIKQKVSEIQTKDVITNVKANAVANKTLPIVQTKIVYKTKYIKEYIHEKESSDIDIWFNNYWLRAINSAKASTPESISYINEASGIIPTN